jgi:PAS domain S-box-containing protein
MISHGREPSTKRRQKVLELEYLRSRLAEAEETLAAIRNGEVDALIVSGESGERVYTLEGAETPYRQLVESMNEGALTVDADGMILYANRRFAELVGEPLQQVAGSNLARYDENNALGGLLQDMQQSNSARREATLPGRDRRIPVFASASRPPGDTSGRICVILTDLTTQKVSEILARAEEDARRHRELAEKRATELARSNTHLETFAYAASHELKEPLRGINNFAGFLLEDHRDCLDQAAQDKVNTILRLSARMHHLLDSLLQFARAGRTQVARQPVPLGDVAREAADSLATFLHDNNARVEIEPNIPPCLCDRERLMQVLINLITNGVKYNASDAKLIEIFVASTEEHAITIGVRDNGIGIEPRQHERIFGVFHRLHGRDAFGGGAGIGLSLVKMLVEQQGGRIWVESSAGAGSTFFLRLPCER